MSLKKRLEEKSAGLIDGLVAAPNQGERVPKTAPGQMLALRAHLRESASRTEELEERVRAFSGAVPVRQLDPARIRVSKWANRHEDSFHGPAFDALKSEIESAGGNVQPIRVRPVTGDAEADYELVFGHRRHRACLQLGLRVSAMVETLDDVSTFVAMDRENRQRADLSAWEQGMMYRRALDEGLFPSLRQLADRLGVDAGNASKAISLARLPREVIDAFASPLDLQFRWASRLSAALQRDPEGVVSRAREIAAQGGRSTPNAVFERLIGAVSSVRADSAAEVVLDGRRVATVRSDSGRVSILFEAGVVSPETAREWVERWMSLRSG